MAQVGNLQPDPLFKGLTRPPMIGGVSYLYFMLNICISMVIYLNTKSLIVLLAAIGIHIAGYFIHKYEPRAIELVQKRYAKCNKAARNRRFHGFSNSYDVF